MDANDSALAERLSTEVGGDALEWGTPLPDGDAHLLRLLHRPQSGHGRSATLSTVACARLGLGRLLLAMADRPAGTPP